MVHWISTTDPNSRVFVIIWDAFLYRAADQINVLNQSNTNVVIISVYPWLCWGKNGKTHQSTWVPWMLHYMDWIEILEPCDTQDFYNILNYSQANYWWPKYIRVHNDVIPSLNVLSKNTQYYNAYEPISVHKMTIVSSGFPVFHSAEVANKLDKEGIWIRVINLINHRSIDSNFIKSIGEWVSILTIYNWHRDYLKNIIAWVILDTNSIISWKLYGHGFKDWTTWSLNDLKKHYKLDWAWIEEICRNILFLNNKNE